ncbi:probable salivary secreted peptide [Teleopsis dalmanni]|uniref:probable salivary secreted peptide n=1 Tax=Teleopsis dalmanni TaxID=139649 RepID=UPI0018CD04DF|nr:probable salivary secreted peptide [Teleopsis dalmanni]
MKFLAVALFISFALATISFNSGYARNTTWGYIGPYDLLLHRDFVVRSSSWLRVISEDVTYPPKGFVNQYIISGVRAIDNARKHGGYATLIRGGPGFRNATIHLKSERSEGLNYTVEFFGRR